MTLRMASTLVLCILFSQMIAVAKKYRRSQATKNHYGGSPENCLGTRSRHG